MDIRSVFPLGLRAQRELSFGRTRFPKVVDYFCFHSPEAN